MGPHFYIDFAMAQIKGPTGKQTGPGGHGIKSSLSGLLVTSMVDWGTWGFETVSKQVGHVWEVMRRYHGGLLLG